MRAARLIKMVLLLQARPSMTGAELARELEVSERTITRDALALSEAGVPVYADRGRAGGYRLIGGYRTRLTGLGRDEAEALFLSGLPGALREMGLEDAASAARLKVSAALLPSLSDAPRTAAQRFHLDAPGWYQEPETPPLLAEIADAVWRDRRLAAVYANRRGERVERLLEPYGLVLKAGVWYLCARVADAEPAGAGAAPEGPGTPDGPVGPNGTGAPGETGGPGRPGGTDRPVGPNGTGGPGGPGAASDQDGTGGPGNSGDASGLGRPGGTNRPVGPNGTGGPGGPGTSGDTGGPGHPGGADQPTGPNGSGGPGHPSGPHKTGGTGTPGNAAGPYKTGTSGNSHDTGGPGHPGNADRPTGPNGSKGPGHPSGPHKTGGTGAPGNAAGPYKTGTSGNSHDTGGPRHPGNADRPTGPNGSGGPGHPSGPHKTGGTGAPNGQNGTGRAYEPPSGPDRPGGPYAPGAFRVYRIDRFTTAEPVPAADGGIGTPPPPGRSAATADDGVFDRDPGFDLPAFWEERAAQFTRSLLRSEVVLRLTEAGARRLPYVTDRAAAREALAAAEPPDAEGRTTIALPVESEEVAYGQLLSLGAEAEVLAPAGLRAEFTRAAARLAALYG